MAERATEMALAWERFRAALVGPHAPMVRITFRFKTGQVLCQVEGVGEPLPRPGRRPAIPLLNGTGTTEAEALDKAVARLIRDQDTNRRDSHANDHPVG